MPNDTRGTWGHTPDDERLKFYGEAVTVSDEDWGRVEEMLAARPPIARMAHGYGDGLGHSEAERKFREAMTRGDGCVSSTRTVKSEPEKPEQRGHSVWLWVSGHMSIPSWRTARFDNSDPFASAVEVVVPIGWGMASSEKLGACLRNTFGTEITANTVLNLATERMDGFSIKEKE